MLFDLVAAGAMEARESAARNGAQEMRLNERPSELRQGFEICCIFGERDAREVDPQEVCEAPSVGMCVQDGVDEASDLFGRVMVIIEVVDKTSEFGTDVFSFP